MRIESAETLQTKPMPASFTESACPSPAAKSEEKRVFSQVTCDMHFSIFHFLIFVSSQIEYFYTVLFITEESLTAFENAKILLSIPTYIILNS